MPNTPDMPIDFGVRRRPNSSNLQWHLSIPQELRHLYGGKRELRQSLKTSDPKEARRLAAALCQQALEQFARQSNELSPRPLEVVSPELAKELAARVATAVLSVDEHLRSNPKVAQGFFGFTNRVTNLSRSKLTIPTGASSRVPTLHEDFSREVDPLDGLPFAVAKEMAAFNKALSLQTAGAQASQRLSSVVELVEAEASKLGLSFERSTPGAINAYKEALRALHEARQDAVKRDEGEYIPTPVQTPLTPLVSPGPILRDVLGPWKAANPNRHPKTVRDTELALAAFESFTGNPAITALTLAQGDDFCAWLLTQSKTSKTAANKLNAVNGLLTFAATRRGLIPHNPWAHLRIKFTKATKTENWSTEEIQRIFSAPVFQRYEIPENLKAGMDAAYWLPLIALFSGARASEIAQLRLVDMSYAIGPDGKESIPIMGITECPEDAELGTHKTSAKTDGSIRKVPIHRELVRLGLLDYVNDLKRLGAVQLFPAIKRNRDRGAGWDISTWFGRLRKDQGVTRKFAGLHAARHTVRTMLADIGATTDKAFAIGGWTSGTGPGNSVYLHGLRPSVLLEVLNRISYEGLVLPRVYVSPQWKP